MKLTQSPTILKGFNVFQKQDGTFFELETTEDEYLALGKENPINPKHIDGTWHHSYLTYVVPPNCWVDERGKRKLVNINGEVFSLPNDGMDGDTINQKGLDEIQAFKDRLK